MYICGSRRAKISGVMYMIFFYYLLYILVWPLFELLYHPRVLGRENIPKNGAVILAGNHKSNLDCILIASCLWRQVHFMAKDELFRGGFRYFFRALGTIPVNRRIRDASALSEARTILDRGGVIGIFPEGRFNKTEETVLPFKPGAARMAARSRAMIVPFAIKGDYNIIGRRVEIEFYSAINAAGRDAVSIGKELENAVREGLERGRK